MSAHPRGARARRPLVLLAAAVLALAAALPLSSPARADQPADEVAAQVDAQRAANGLGPLVRDPALDASAYAWAYQMASTGTFAHSTNPWRQGYARPGWSSCCGENIAAGYSTSTQVMQGWMASTGHRANILGGYTHLGVGHVVVAGSPYGHYWVQVFASYPFDRAGHEAFVGALYRDFLGRAASAADVRYWTDQLAAGKSRQWVAANLAASAEWIGSVVDGYYTDTLGRPADAAGRAYWTSVLRSGRPVAHVAAEFYGSVEYRQRVAGGDVTGWVRDLYRTLLGREGDAGGVAYWTRAVASGVPYATVALDFYQSEESCRARVTHLYRALLGRDPDPVGLASWPAVVRARGDLSLAADLAASQEYFDRARG